MIENRGVGRQDAANRIVEGREEESGRLRVVIAIVGITGAGGSRKVCFKENQEEEGFFNTKQ